MVQSEQLRLFRFNILTCSYSILYLGGENAAVLHHKSNSTFEHWFVFTHVVILAQWIDLGSTTHNTNCSIAWQRSICHHTPVLSLLMHSSRWLCLEIHLSAEERAQEPHSATNTIISSPSLCCCLSAALSCSMTFTQRSQTKKGLPKKQSKHVFNRGSF